MSTKKVYQPRDQPSKSLSGATAYHQRGISTMISEAKHIWHSCISPAARHSCISTAIKSSESTVGRRSRVDQGSISTAISKANHIWSNCASPTLYVNRVQQRKSTCGAAVYHQGGISTAINKSKAYLAQLYINSNHKTKRKHRVDQRGISTAISKAKAYPAQPYISSTVYQPRSANGNIIWRNCIPSARNINRNNHSGSISGVAVYQQPSKA